MALSEGDTKMAVNRNREMIQILLTTIDIDDLTIKECIAKLNEYLEAYGEDAVFDTCDLIEIYQPARLETDEEMAERICKEEKEALLW
jgi:hypothetical protein